MASTPPALNPKPAMHLDEVFATRRGHLSYRGAYVPSTPALQTTGDP
jgi:hypothetical protein